jgi:hypothetical protein
MGTKIKAGMETRQDNNSRATWSVDRRAGDKEHGGVNEPRRVTGNRTLCGHSVHACGEDYMKIQNE